MAITSDTKEYISNKHRQVSKGYWPPPTKGQQQQERNQVELGIRPPAWPWEDEKRAS